jgi:predicted nucleotidyltransferase
MDCHGFCVPHKNMVFPHLSGEIFGFGKQIQRFRVWQEHHIKSEDGTKEYDFNIYNIVDFFNLAMENNPNCLELLFLPRRCVLHSTPLAEHVRSHRHLFLTKNAMHKLRGYAFSQLSKIRNKTNSTNPKRAASIEAHGYDVKFGMHVVRLALQAEQILAEHDLDVERNSEILKSVRRGEWTLEQIETWFDSKERALETLYANSTLRAMPDEQRIKTILLECLEQHFGSLEEAIKREIPADVILRDLKDLINRYGP